MNTLLCHGLKGMGVIVWLALVTGLAGVEAKCPNDPFFSRQLAWGHQGVAVEWSRSSRVDRPVRYAPALGIHHRVAEAWALSTGSSRVVVALLDDGFSYRHEDIAENIWRNPGESGLDASGYAKESNGVDDDRNGYVDDVMGWDFAFDDPDPDPYAFDGKDTTRIATYDHSIPALGIIGARGNNGIGVAGINWRVSLMLLRLTAQGDYTAQARVERAAKAIRYAVDNGASIIHWSGSVATKDPQVLQPLAAAVAYAGQKGVLLVVAAGNDRQDLDLPENRFFPACFPGEHILTVAEIDYQGKLYVVPSDDPKYVGGSNYGATQVDIAALAEVYTTSSYENRSTYAVFGGTSNAAPVVSGVAALMLAVNPRLAAPTLRQLLLRTCKPLPELQGKVVCGGMVDAYAAVAAAQQWRRAGVLP